MIKLDYREEKEYTNKICMDDICQVEVLQTLYDIFDLRSI
jgi:hypothetical protein